MKAAWVIEFSAENRGRWLLSKIITNCGNLRVGKVGLPPLLDFVDSGFAAIRAERLCLSGELLSKLFS